MPSIGPFRLRVCRLLFLAAGLCLSLCLPAALAQAYYVNADGESRQILTAQIWYSGYWKFPGWINGTVVPLTMTGQTEGNICASNRASPYEPVVREMVEAGCAAALILRDRDPTSDVPGSPMYYLVTGNYQESLTIPVVEGYQYLSATPDALWTLLQTSSTGLPVQILPQPNKWKIVAETSGFQIPFTVLISLIELAVVALGVWRMAGWILNPGAVLFSIGPVCIVLHMCSSLIKLVFMLVDPFWTYRILSYNASVFFLIGWGSFFFSAGILLTMFWAETLRSNKVQATPFISEYKPAAFVAVFLLFAGVSACMACVILVDYNGSFSPSYVIQAFYAITAIILIVCYIMCAVSITKRLGASRTRRLRVFPMMLRFSVSSLGYFVFIICIVLQIQFSTSPWPFRILMNVMFLFTALASLLQIWSFHVHATRMIASTKSKSNLSAQDSMAPKTASGV